jgi:uncharacterized protein
MTEILPTLSSIYIYPVKSCRGIAIAAGELNSWGLEYDRHWMIVSGSGKFITQREEPRLALIGTEIQTQTLKLSAPELPDLEIPLDRADQAGKILVVVWRDQCQAIDQGNEAAAWFSNYLQRDCRLVRMGEDFNRPVSSAYARHPAQVSFADGFPMLLISEASLADLNSRLLEPLPMNRFRPNFVVSGCEPYAEDTWQTIQIGEIVFDVVKPCERCIITTTDQTTAIRSKEPLLTLGTYRRSPKGAILFGQNIIPRTYKGEVKDEVKGEVYVGQTIQVI